MENLSVHDLTCANETTRALIEMGFETMTPIQTQAIPKAIEGVDLVGQAQTGTGKTAAFGIPIFERIDASVKDTQALILCPTRELAVQVSEALNTIGKYHRGINVVPVYGGASIDRQIQLMRRGAHIVVGTPGRVMDHLRRRTLKLNNLKMFTLDEADEMLNMGFREDIETVLETVPADAQRMLFSATMPKAILSIIKNYLREPTMIRIQAKEITTDTIQQLYVKTRNRDREAILTRFIELYSATRTIVFCNTKRKVDELVEWLSSRGYQAERIHGDMDQSARMNVIRRYKEGKVQVLVATDVAARGLDIPAVELVFNFELPRHEEYYVHRIGRTGRAGLKGTAISFVTAKEMYTLKSIMRYTKKTIEEVLIPKKETIEKIHMDRLLAEVKEIAENEDMSKALETMQGQEGFLGFETMAAALLTKMLKGSAIEEIDNAGMSGFRQSDRKVRGVNGRVKLFINIGRKEKVDPRDLVRVITKETDVTGREIGKINVYNEFSFIEVPEEHAKHVIQRLRKKTINGTRINVEISREKKSSGNRDGGSHSHNKRREYGKFNKKDGSKPKKRTHA
ncbi:DEAD/DEAH box helicase [Gottschalkiaceae bacterium SANA]|nr:DEAD/DEAH box helicase [Gottschalkiaceae bacterium SANA]